MKLAKQINCRSCRHAVLILLSLAVSNASATEPPAIRATLADRAADYQRLDPGVPAWPSTCDCISVDFGFKESSGFRPVRFSIGDAERDYGRTADPVYELRREKMSAKGPRKEFAEDAALSQ